MNLDVKSKPSRRSRSSSVDNTAPPGSSTPTKTTKEKRKSKTKKLSGIKLPCSTPPLGGSPLGSPMGSPRVNSPYSPAHSPLPSCASPVAGARSPALGKRNSRGTPVSPLLSPSINAEISFQSILSDSNSSLVDNVADDEAYHTLDQSTESLSSSFCNRERRGSSSSISSIASINSPLANLSLNNGSGTYNGNSAFNFHPSPISSPVPPPLQSLSQYSDSELSHPDCALQQMPPPLLQHGGGLNQPVTLPPPSYEEALYRNGSCRPLHHRSSHPAHQLHISHSPDIVIRPRSTSVPVSVDFNHLPPDLDASLFNGDTGFNTIDMNNILQNEMELNGGKLDFDIEQVTIIPSSEQYHSFAIQQQIASKTATM